jgi:hypothetical protein
MEDLSHRIHVSERKFSGRDEPRLDAWRERLISIKRDAKQVVSLGSNGRRLARTRLSAAPLEAVEKRNSL